MIGPILSGVLLELGNGSALSPSYGINGYGAVEIFVGSCALATGLMSIVVAAARRTIVT